MTADRNLHFGILEGGVRTFIPQIIAFQRLM